MYFNSAEIDLKKVIWEKAEPLHFSFYELKFIRFETAGLLQGHVFFRCEFCGLVSKWHDGRSRPLYKECKSYRPITGSISEIRKLQICNEVMDHRMRYHAANVTPRYFGSKSLCKQHISANGTSIFEPIQGTDENSDDDEGKQ